VYFFGCLLVLLAAELLVQAPIATAIYGGYSKFAGIADKFKPMYCTCHLNRLKWITDCENIGGPSILWLRKKAKKAGPYPASFYGQTWHIFNATED